jgi:hypothetical protein
MNAQIKVLKELNKAYYNGIREGIGQFAYWKDGEQVVGTFGTTLKWALKRIDAEEKHAFEKIKSIYGYGVEE